MFITIRVSLHKFKLQETIHLNERFYNRIDNVRFIYSLKLLFKNCKVYYLL